MRRTCSGATASMRSLSGHSSSAALSMRAQAAVRHATMSSPLRTAKATARQRSPGRSSSSCCAGCASDCAARRKAAGSPPHQPREYGSSLARFRVCSWQAACLRYTASYGPRCSTLGSTVRRKTLTWWSYASSGSKSAKRRADGAIARRIERLHTRNHKVEQSCDRSCVVVVVDTGQQKRGQRALVAGGWGKLSCCSSPGRRAA